MSAYSRGEKCRKKTSKNFCNKKEREDPSPFSLQRSNPYGDKSYGERLLPDTLSHRKRCLVENVYAGGENPHIRLVCLQSVSTYVPVLSGTLTYICVFIVDSSTIRAHSFCRFGESLLA